MADAPGEDITAWLEELMEASRVEGSPTADEASKKVFHHIELSSLELYLAGNYLSYLGRLHGREDIITSVHTFEWITEDFIKVHEKAGQLVVAAMQNHVNFEHRRTLREEATYDQKRARVKEFNAKLRKVQASVELDGDPHILYAVQSSDGAGRYLFENRITKKRKGFFKSYDDLLPLKLMVDKGAEYRTRKGD